MIFWHLSGNEDARKQRLRNMELQRRRKRATQEIYVDLVILKARRKWGPVAFASKDDEVRKRTMIAIAI
jgi:hypothetical protein